MILRPALAAALLLYAVAAAADAEKSMLHGVDLAPATAPAENFGRPPPPATVEPTSDASMPAALSARVPAQPVHARRAHHPGQAVLARARARRGAAKPAAATAMSPWRAAFIKRHGHPPPSRPGLRGAAGSARKPAR